ncbi:Juvenile hormone esterase, partial [Pseudolycoriella hygida]
YSPAPADVPSREPSVNKTMPSGGSLPLSQSSLGDEDCLYVNVYVPETSSGQLLDVLVWIHGGAFVIGSGGPSSYSPDYLLDNDVILVAGNYRLGMLGFLSTEDRNSPGNFGLKDQSFMLQWVQDNIEHFGGNKNSVTIWGESAGAASVHYQMISPMSRGLFHKAILNSGTLNNAWCDPPRSGIPRQQAMNLAEYVNCTTEDATTEEIVQCLRGISARDIVSFNSVAPYPVVESFESDEDAFIGERNLNALFANSLDIPMLVGMNSEEGLLTMAYQTIASSFGYAHLSESERDEITKKINNFYFGRETTPTNQLDRNHLINLFTDGSFIGMVETLKHRLERNHESTFVYLYTQKGTSSFSVVATEFFGTSHADELISLFPLRKNAFYSAIPSEQELELNRLMSEMWTNFARTGNPTPVNTSNVIWPLATSFPLNYMQIGNENGKFDNQILQPRVDFYAARANFWMDLRNEHRISSWIDGNSSAASRYSLVPVGLGLLLFYVSFVNFY